MKDELITYKVAKLAKEKEFDVPTLYHYCSLEEGHRLNGELFRSDRAANVSYGEEDKNSDHKGACSAPTQSLLQRHLREVHNLVVVALPYTIDDEEGTVVYIWLIHKRFSSTAKSLYFKTFEEALEDGLQETLKLIP